MSALVIVSVLPERRTPTRNLYTPATRNETLFGSVPLSISNSRIGVSSQSSDEASSVP